MKIRNPDRKGTTSRKSVRELKHHLVREVENGNGRVVPGEEAMGAVGCGRTQRVRGVPEPGAPSVGTDVLPLAGGGAEPRIAGAFWSRFLF